MQYLKICINWSHIILPAKYLRVNHVPYYAVSYQSSLWWLKMNPVCLTRHLNPRQEVNDHILHNSMQYCYVSGTEYWDLSLRNMITAWGQNIHKPALSHDSRHQTCCPQSCREFTPCFLLSLQNPHQGPNRSASAMGSFVKELMT